jgi:hypothetical protein
VIARGVAAAGAALALAAAACAVEVPSAEPWPALGGVEPFAELAQPVLAERCANPSCHGNPDRPLAVFAVHRYRLDPDATFLDAPLTAEELERNFVRAAAFLLEVDAAEDSALLAKALAREAGGSGHDHGAVFTDRAEHDYVQLLDWATLALDAR